MKNTFIRFKFRRERRALRIALLSALFVGIMLSSSVQAGIPTRERISLNDDWRFQKGDSPEAAGRLEYEKIKDLVTMTGNEFTKGSATPAVPSERSDFAKNVPWIQPGFDDRGWRKLNLPHDWGIEGPFAQEYPGDTG